MCDLHRCERNLCVRDFSAMLRLAQYATTTTTTTDYVITQIQCVRIHANTRASGKGSCRCRRRSTMATTSRWFYFERKQIAIPLPLMFILCGVFFSVFFVSFPFNRSVVCSVLSHELTVSSGDNVYGIVCRSRRFDSSSLSGVQIRERHQQQSMHSAMALTLTHKQ